MASKTKLTTYVEPVVHRSLKIAAAREGIKESELVERALRAELGIAATDASRELSRMTPEEALAAAAVEVRTYRRTHPITR